jgi:glyoxylase-like metal-dependent hydrolase (beta-lactamase superfamily II)
LDARAQLAPEVSVALGAAVWRIVAGNAGLMTGPGTNTYVFGEHERTVLDPGPDDERHLQAILTAGGAKIRWILATHTHRDHSPLAGKLARLTGAQVIGLPAPLDGRQDESFAPDHKPADGEVLTLGDRRVVAIHTPGHASNCVCYLLERQRLLFTGDHVLEGVSPVILPPDGDMGAYITSLDKLMPFDFERIAPGHGDVMSRPKRVLTALRAHRIFREDKVLRRLAAVREASIAILTPLVYDDVPADRHEWARLTLQAHLIKLQREGRVAEQGGNWRPTRSPSE